MSTRNLVTSSTLLALLPCLLLAQPTTRTIHIGIPAEIWPGWRSGLIDPDPHPVTLPPERFVEFPTPQGQRATFSGRVIGVDSFENAEVAVVPLLGAEYPTNHALQWTMLRDDGTFWLTARDEPELPRTLCVRTPGKPWTFLRHDFAMEMSGRDVELRPAEGRRIRISAAVRDGPPGKWVSVDVFDGYQQFDDAGRPVRSRYYGGKQSDGGQVEMILPARPMALRVRTDGSAMGCAIVDPRRVDAALVRLPGEAKLRARVVDGDRKITGRPVWLFNPCARLSAAAIETDADGAFELAGLMPGEYRCIVMGKAFGVELAEGQTTQATFDLRLGPDAEERVPTLRAMTGWPDSDGSRLPIRHDLLEDVVQ